MLAGQKTDPSMPEPSPAGIGQRLRFTGTGGEYFRIWIVNLLLSIVTLGFYAPWAKIRRLQYFHRNTYLADSPFDYHGRPLPILVGRIVTLVLLGVYANPEIFTPFLSLAAAALVVLLLPLLLQRSLRFRLRNTSWHNLRFAFDGTVGQAYRAAAVPVGLTLILVLLASGGLYGASLGLGPTVDATLTRVPALIAIAIAAVLAMLVLGPLLLALFFTAYRRYAGNHARFGSARFALALRLRDVVKVQLQAMLLYVGALLLPGLLLALVAFAAGSTDAGAAMVLLPFAVGLLAYLATWAVAGFVTSRLMRAVWNRTRVDQHRFICDLTARRYALLLVTNLVLTVLTLGFYRPFAAVATARMKVESIRFVPFGSIESVIALADRDALAIGEEVADALDLDLAF